MKIKYILNVFIIKNKMLKIVKILFLKIYKISLSLEEEVYIKLKSYIIIMLIFLFSLKDKITYCCNIKQIISNHTYI